MDGLSLVASTGETGQKGRMLARLKPFSLPLVILGLTVLRLVAAGRAGLVPDEAYYWLWAQHPALGYYDHPPMVAWWIEAFGWLGHAAFVVRLPFVLSFLALSWLVYDICKVLFDQAVARRAVLWVNACILLSVGSVIATPDPPSVLMWAGGLWALARLQASNKGWWWLVFGVFAGLGVEAKYTNFFLGLGVIAWMIVDKPSRRWLLTPWPYLGAVVAAAFMAPNLMWNAEHHWITVAKQFGRIEASHFTGQYLVEFILTQPLLLNPLIFAFVYIGTFGAFQNKDSRLRMLAALPLPLLAYLLIHVFHDRIQGNWPAPVYPGLVILAAVMAEGISDGKLNRARDWAAPVGITISAVVLLLLALSPNLPAAGPLGGWRPFATGVNQYAKAASAGWIATTDYDTQGELSYYSATPIGMAQKARYPWQAPEPTGSTALIVVAPNHPFDLSLCFDDVRDLGTISRGKPGKKADFHLYSGVLRQADCELK